MNYVKFFNKNKICKFFIIYFYFLCLIVCTFFYIIYYKMYLYKNKIIYKNNYSLYNIKKYE